MALVRLSFAMPLSHSFTFGMSEKHPPLAEQKE
jgi:hypothetical protein